MVGATNRVELLDDALLRPGRFDKIIHVPTPDLESRLEILKVAANKIPVNRGNFCDLKRLKSFAFFFLFTVSEVDLRYYAENTEGFSGADLDNFCKEVALRALTVKGFSVEEINPEDFQAVFETFRASVKS